MSAQRALEGLALRNAVGNDPITPSGEDQNGCRRVVKSDTRIGDDRRDVTSSCGQIESAGRVRRGANQRDALTASAWRTLRELDECGIRLEQTAPALALHPRETLVTARDYDEATVSDAPSDIELRLRESCGLRHVDDSGKRT